MIDVFVTMSGATCHFTCDITMRDLMSFSRAFARRNVMRMERRMKRQGTWNGGLATSAVEDMALRSVMYRPNMYAYFDAFVGAMRRGDVPAARCERCDRPAELSGVSVLDGSFLCRRCRWKRIQRLEEAMQEDDECTTRCCTDDGQGGDA